MPPKAATTSSASAGRQIQFLWRKSVITELIASANLALSLTGPATSQTGPAGGRLASYAPYRDRGLAPSGSTGPAPNRNRPAPPLRSGALPWSVPVFAWGFFARPKSVVGIAN